MKKMYQVFVSSTYEDLIDERIKVLNALLSFSCIPAGMELFSAGCDEQFEYIKRVIDRVDYYVLIVAGRYGRNEYLGGQTGFFGEVSNSNGLSEADS